MSASNRRAKLDRHRPDFIRAPTMRDARRGALKASIANRDRPTKNDLEAMRPH